MDTYEVTKMVLSRIMSFEPASASRIMGYMMIQSQGDNEMLRLAYCPESVLLTRISEAKAFLGIDNCSNPPLSNSIRHNEPPFLQSSPRIMIPSNGFHLSNPSSPAAAAAAAAGFPRSSPRPISYAAVVNGSNGSPSSSSRNNGSGSPSLQFYGGGSSDFTDQFLGGGGGGGGGGGRVPHQLQDHLLFLDDSPMVDPIMSPSGRSDSMLFPYREDANGLPSPHPHPFHRRSSSVNDAAFLSNLEEVAAAAAGGGGGFGWRPCMYFAKGFCKNGSSCKFSHSEFGDGESIEMGSPNSSRFEEFFRMKALQQQRFAIMGHHSFPHNKNDFFPSGASSSARQIYLTFPADSTFREEDVSSYFSTFGPVQDVRIPYQPKRMFGFVTFVYPETVKHILAKGNPHFVCDSRVLVKPYKDKGKVPDKKHHQHFETGEYSGSLSPSGIDSREIFDLPVGPRMFSNSQEMMQRRKMEQEAAELHHAIQLQSRRMTNLQLIDPNNNQQLNHRFMLNLPAGVPISSPRQHPQLLLSQNVTPPFETTNQHVLQDEGQEASVSIAVANDDQKLSLEGTESSNNNTLNGNNNHEDASDDDFYLPESLEHHLPDNLFSSPTKSAAERHSVFSAEADNGGVTITNTSSNNSPVQYSNSPLGIDSLSYSRRTRNQ